MVLVEEPFFFPGTVVAVGQRGAMTGDWMKMCESSKEDLGNLGKYICVEGERESYIWMRNLK